MRKLLFILSCILLGQFSADAQTGFSFSCAKDTTIDGCANPCLTLKTKIPDVRSSTGNYAVYPISGPGGCFNPYVSPNTPGTAVTLTIDDRYSSVVPLPFSFPFYDDAASPYNSLIVSTNGFISFDVAEAGNFAHWDMDPAGNVPSVDYDKSLIMGVFHDLDPSVTTSPNQRIKYEVTGTAPHRRFVFSVYKSPLFGTGCTNLINNTHQIVLYEGLGIIEVFVFDLEQCPSWNSGRKMIGLQNANKDRGIMAPGRTATGPNWGTAGMNESWRFVPASGPTLFRGVELYDLNGNLISTGDTVSVGNQTFEVSFPNVCPQGTTTYIVKSKYAQFNNPGAFVYGTDTVRVISNNPLGAASAVAPATCANLGIGSAAIFVSGAPGPFEFSSNNGQSWQNSSVFNLPPGTYTIKYREIGGTCSATTQIVIPADANLVAGNYSVSSVKCNGQSNGSINATGLNGTAPFQYSINNGATFQNGGVFNNLAAGTYTIRIKDNTGCTRDTTILVVQPTALNLSGTTVNSTCSATPNGGIQMEAVGGTITYEYSINGGAYQSSPNFTVAEGTYNVSVRDANGCIATSQQVVSLTNDLTVSSRSDTTICFGGSVELTTTGNATSYSWSGNGLNNNNIASPIATPSGLGVTAYTVTATLGQCTATEVVNITTQSQVQVNAGNDVSIVYGETVQLNATVTGASTYTWTSSPVDNTLSSTTVPNPTATPLITTTYTITATNASGCTASDQVTVTVIPYCIRVRNAFTPNNDGINDKWQVYDQYDCLENVVVTVFNRYGTKVFESKNYRNDWDGTYKNKPVPDGTYYGVIEFRLLDKRVMVKKTDITIIR